MVLPNHARRELYAHQQNYAQRSEVKQYLSHEGWDIYSNCDGSSVNECFNPRALNAHNRYREKHRVPLLVLDENLVQIAQAHAEKLNNIDITPDGTNGVGKDLMYQDVKI